MFTVESLRELHAHMEWADALVWSTILESEEAAGDGRVRETLAHIHLVQRVYLATWTRRPWRAPTADEVADLASIWHWAHPTYAETQGFLASATETTVAEPLPEAFVRQMEDDLGPRLRSPTIAESAFQVASHSTHHRAQVSTRLRELGITPPQVDYIVWVWRGRPASLWPSPPVSGRIRDGEQT